MEIIVSETAWQGRKAFTLENSYLRAAVVPSIGAKLVSIFDKRQELEWLVGPGERPLRPVPYGASFIEQDMSGWDEMFPTIVACDYPGPGARQGEKLPDHGEVWTLPWNCQVSKNSITVSVEGQALPYQLTRIISFLKPDILALTYRLQNLGEESMPYLWAAHPQFLCDERAVIELPASVEQVINTLSPEWGWGELESTLSWPEATSPGGERVKLNVIGPPELTRARKFYIPPTRRIRWAVLRRPAFDSWLRMSWDPDQVPYFGLWIDEGAISSESVAAPEPATGFYDSLQLAWEKGQVKTILPGKEHRWSLSIQLGRGKTDLE